MVISEREWSHQRGSGHIRMGVSIMSGRSHCKASQLVTFSPNTYDGFVTNILVTRSKLFVLLQINLSNKGILPVGLVHNILNSSASSQ